MDVLIIGADGQLGHDLFRVLGKDQDIKCLSGLNHSQIEISNFNSVLSALTSRKFDVVINTAAFHKVEECEVNPSLAFSINAVGAKNLSDVCNDQKIKLMNISTDYVFSGKEILEKKRSVSYNETCITDPINSYGVSKVAGEMLTSYSCEKHYIIRTAGLYGAVGPSGKGENFVDKIVKLALNDKKICVVDDQITTPTSTLSLAKQISFILKLDHFGVYHATCQGECSWFEFAQEIISQCGFHMRIESKKTDCNSIVKRPHYSVLDNMILRLLGVDVMPDWKESLNVYLKEKNYIK